MFSCSWHGPEGCTLLPTLFKSLNTICIENLLISYHFKCYSQGMFQAFIQVFTNKQATTTLSQGAYFQFMISSRSIEGEVTIPTSSIKGDATVHLQTLLHVSIFAENNVTCQVDILLYKTEDFCRSALARSIMQLNLCFNRPSP